VLNVVGFSVLDEPDVFEHFLGKKTAAIPDMQIRVKTAPINGFLQRKLSWIVGGKSASISVESNPKMETLTVNFTRRFRVMH